jgi:hypothetical protein
MAASKLSMEINWLVLEYIKRYILFQISNGFPPNNEINIVINNGSPTFFRVPPQTIPISAEELPSEYTRPSFVYKRITKPRDYAGPIYRYITDPLFKCDSERLYTFHTGSANELHSKYYIPVFNGKEDEPGSYHQFDIAYAHISGSGSSYMLDQYTNAYPAKSMYKKYLLECLDNKNNKFPFKNGINGDYFYAIHFNKELFKDRIDPGNIQIHLSPIVSNQTQSINTGSNFYANDSSSIVYSLIDDSGDGDNLYSEHEDTRDYYYLVSGSLNQGIYGKPTDNAWGVIFPRKGIIILDGVVLDQSCSFNTVTASIDGDNIRKLFVSISSSAIPTTYRIETGSWYGRSAEEKIVETYFCRIGANEMNYSNNSTYISGSNRVIKQARFYEEPKVYVSSIGLYNERRELVAIGKLKNPILKKDTEEYVFQVRVRLN